MFSFGVMASGGGSNFKALLEKVQDGSLRAKCAFLIVNNGDCGAVQIAIEFGVPTFHISGKTHPEQLEYELKDTEHHFIVSFCRDGSAPYLTQQIYMVDDGLVGGKPLQGIV